MAKITSFEELKSWQQARELCKLVFEFSKKIEFSKEFSLKDQIKRSSGSVMDNIAEGFERNGNKEFIQFLSIAKASCGETRSQLYRVFDRSYINEKEFNKLKEQALVLSKMIGGFINYLKKSEFKGSKYKN